MKGFLLFSLYWCDDEGPQRILGFELHSLIKLLRYRRLFLHIDATFDGAPRGFYQVLIFSVLDQGTNLHVPIFYCPMTRKSEEAYNLFQNRNITIRHLLIRDFLHSFIL